MPNDDPYSPDYHADADGGVGGDPGSGPGFGASLYGLYRAGRLDLPNVAQVYSEMTSTVHGVTPQVNGTAADAGSPAALTEVGDLITTLHLALERTAENVRDTGTALVRIADSYVATDAAARSAFNDRLGFDREDYTSPVPDIGDPPHPGDPSTSGPGHPGSAPGYGNPDVELPDYEAPDTPDVDIPEAEDDDEGSTGPSTD